MLKNHLIPDSSMGKNVISVNVLHLYVLTQIALVVKDRYTASEPHTWGEVMTRLNGQGEADITGGVTLTGRRL